MMMQFRIKTKKVFLAFFWTHGFIEILTKADFLNPKILCIQLNLLEAIHLYKF